MLVVIKAILKMHFANAFLMHCTGANGCKSNLNILCLAWICCNVVEMFVSEYSAISAESCVIYVNSNIKQGEIVIKLLDIAGLCWTVC